ncbi:MAG TPA: hypothetical protein VFZ59_24210 [Verrucomicrobiae bacterium]|nr:hypothetical protein [Verrucomicrobiae bacterium]
MKTHQSTPRQDGNVLVICLFTCAILGFAIASCFVYVRNQMTAAARSQSWNESLVISEAGIEDGLMLINKYSDTTTPRGWWTNTATDDSWTRVGNAPLVFWVQRTLNGSRYDVFVTNGTQPWIRSVGTKSFSAGRAAIQRAIVVRATPGSLFQGGLIAKGGVTLQGNVLVDSFNSQLAGANIDGKYDPSIRRDNGSIASASSNVVATVTAGGSVQVYGKVYTGPEDGFVSNGGATIGSEAFVDGASTGIESGFVQNDLNLYVPDAPTPSTTGIPLPAKGNTVVGTNTYTSSYYLTEGSYRNVGNLQLSSSDKIVVSGNVKLEFMNDFKMSGSSQIIILPNSSLTIYARDSVDLAGGGVMNQTGYATNLTINGLPTCTSIKYTGSSDFVGTIYAPYAYLELSGGGSSDLHFVGSAVASSIKVSGHTQVHYDESLLQLPSGPHYYTTLWAEIPLSTTTSSTSSTSSSSTQTF